ncbi:MAG TPA: TetR/AcrR family transcriptional regulator [Cellulomonas sp.]
MTGPSGRPRSDGQRDTAGAVLSAAAELFSSVGYTATSTYAVAERAGVRQASIYHHFQGKAAILRVLLLGTIRPSLALADHLVGLPAGAAARLWALCDADARLLADGPVNLGVLMRLPEVEAEEFADVRDQRGRLRARYGELVAAVVRTGDGDPAPAPDAGAVLVFGLVESVVAGRRDGGVERASRVAPLVADAALRVLGLAPAAIEAARAEAAGLALPALVPVVDLPPRTRRRAAAAAGPTGPVPPADTGPGVPTVDVG